MAKVISLMATLLLAGCVSLSEGRSESPPTNASADSGGQSTVTAAATPPQTLSLPASSAAPKQPLDQSPETPLIGAFVPQFHANGNLKSHPIFFKHRELLSASIDNPLKQNWMAAHFINVGQGEAILLEFDCGAALIDTGGEARTGFNSNTAIAAALKAFFARRVDLDNTLDLLLLSHPRIDHTRGVETVLKTVKVKHLVDDGINHGSGIAQQRKAEEWAKKNKVPYEAIDIGKIEDSDGYTSKDPIECPTVDPEIRVLWGGADGYDIPENENDHSVVVRIDFGKSSFLFTGDLEEEGIAQLLQMDPAVLDVDVLKVGHHGSKNATTRDLLKATSPRVAAISVGDPSVSKSMWTAFTYGHPNKIAVDLLTDSAVGVSEVRTPKTVPIGLKGGASAEFTSESINKAIYATGWDGAFSIYASASGKLSVKLGSP